MNQPDDLTNFLHHTQKFIDYEERQLASKAVYKPTAEKGWLSREIRPKKENGGQFVNPKFELIVSPSSLHSRNHGHKFTMNAPTRSLKT